MQVRLLVPVALLLLAALAPAASATMIWWEDPCDSTAGYTWTTPSLWRLSVDYSHGESNYGIGLTTGTVTSLTTYSIGRSLDLPPTTEYVEFYYFFEKVDPADTATTAEIYVLGNTGWKVDLDSYIAWAPNRADNQNRWVHVKIPISYLPDRECGLRYEFVQNSNSKGGTLCFDTIRVLTEDMVPMFSGTPTTGDPPLTVRFRDETSWKSDSIAGWHWEFGDGGTSTLQHPSHTYNIGNALYDVSLTVYTIYGESRTTTRSAYVTVGTVRKGDFIMDFTADPTSGDSPLTVTFTGTVSPANTDITNWKWTFSDGGIDYYGQTVSHTFNTYSAAASYDVTLTGYSSDGAFNATTKSGYITLVGSQSSGVSRGAINVRFVVQDYVGNRFDNVTVVATPLESTSPWSWLEELFGVPPEVDVKNQVLTGTTGTDGGIVFSLIESVKYRVQFTDELREINTTITIYPKEDEVPIYIWPTDSPPMGRAVTHDLFTRPTDDEHTELGLRYADVLNQTRSVTFTVRDENRTILHQETVEKSNATLTYEMKNDPPRTYYFGFTADHATYGEITQDRFITFTSDRPLVDLAPWIPRDIYNWAALCIIVLIAAIPGYFTAKFGVVFVPAFAAFFSFIGWLLTPWYLISGALALGVLIYIRWTEGDTGT